MSIPKIIHLTWFSGDEYPPQIKKCIDSWKKVLPDFEIKIWDREHALSANIAYVNEAIECKKWAFASDVIRLYALYHFGGVYMDTDVFLLKRFDEFMSNKVTFFQEYHPNLNVTDQIDDIGNKLVDCVNGCGIQAAFLISEKENPCISYLLTYYYDKHFHLDSNGKIRNGELISPSIYAIMLEKYGYKYKDVTQKLNIGDAIIYSSKYVAGGEKEVTGDSFAIHQCEHSWYDYTKFELIKRKCKRYIKNVLKLFNLI